MRKGKWIQGASPDEPVSAVAREALRARLRTVCYYLPLASFKSDRDVEYVHQVRVSTRRAVALLRIFRSLLNDEDAAWLDRQLKRIRRAASEARDLDVLGQRVAQWVESHPSTARAALLYRIERHRDRAQRPVRKVQKKMADKGLARRVEKIVKRARWREETPEPSFAGAASACLRTVAEPFYEAGAQDTADLTALHNFRITAKHLRYSMEVFATAFGPEFRAELYPCFEEVQTRLGEVHDHAAALDRFQTWQAEWHVGPETAALGELIDVEKGELAKSRQNFIRWWTPERAQDLRAKFEQAIATQARATGEKSA